MGSSFHVDVKPTSHVTLSHCAVCLGFFGCSWQHSEPRLGQTTEISVLHLCDFQRGTVQEGGLMLSINNALAQYFERCGSPAD